MTTLDLMLKERLKLFGKNYFGYFCLTRLIAQTFPFLTTISSDRFRMGIVVEIGFIQSWPTTFEIHILPERFEMLYLQMGNTLLYY